MERTAGKPTQDGTGESSPKASRIARWRPSLSRWVPIMAVACFLAWSFVAIRPDFSWDDSEPEILNLAWRLANGETIYRGIEEPPFAFAPYPPLYFAATAAMLKFTGLSYLPAKLLSFLAALSIGWALACLSRQWHGTRKPGLWAACLLFLIPAFLYNSVRCQAPILAVAFSVWSLVFFLRNRRIDTLCISPLLAVLAFYTKQTQIALPLAMIVYLALKNRRWLFPYAAVLAAGGLIPFLWLQHITHGYFYNNTVELAQLAYKAWLIIPIFLHHAGPLIIFLALALSICLRRFKAGTWEAVDWYLVCVSGLTFFALGRVGAHGQYVLELLVAALLFLLRTTGLPAIRGREALVSIQILILLLYAPLFVAVEEGWWDMSANRAAGRIYSLIQESPGPVLAQQNSFPLFSRGGIHIQLFHFTGLARAGLWDQNRLVREIDARTFGCVVTEFPFEEPVRSDNAIERFTPEMIQALRRNYRRIETAFPYYFYMRAP